MKRRMLKWLIFCTGLLVFIAQPAWQPEAQARAKSTSKSYSTIKRQMRGAQERINNLRGQRSSVLQEIELLDAESDRLNNELKQANHIMHVKQEKLAASKQKLADLENELVRRKALVAERMDATYMQGELTYLDLVFNADNFREFMNRAFYLNLIFEKDKELILSVKEEKVQVDEERQKLDRAVAEIAVGRQKLTEQESEIAEVRKEKAILVRTIEHDEILAEREYKELQEESRRITQFLSTSSGYSGKWAGRFMQPVPGRIGSGFGPRLHPISHKYQMHYGVDIGAAYGTPIRAAGDGKVVLVGYQRGYGNHLIIDHGGGVATHYAHCSRFAVSAGDIVKAGQVIAYVGSTGYSTGPHLHFEVLVHGVAVNPLGKM
jgi:murein DD-endopeptidase MepM/ murein hydrolase activator NlpD